MLFRLYLFVGAVAACLPVDADELRPEIVFEGLADPCGVAVQPQTEHLFVSDSGRGRVVRIVDGKLEEVIVGFPLAELTLDSSLRAGPLGLAFLDNDTLVIGGGGRTLAEDVLYVVKVPKPGESPRAITDALKLGPVANSDSQQPAGDFFGVAVTNSAIFATSASADGSDWIVKATVRDIQKPNVSTSFGSLRRFATRQPSDDLLHPTGITISSRGELVVGHMGRADQTSDSRLSFLRSTDGALLLDLEIRLRDIVSVCYGPVKPPANKAQLYALDAAWGEPSEGGLFRLDAAFDGVRPGVLPAKLASLQRPTAMALGDNGILYVTELGAQVADSDPSGRLVAFSQGL